MAFIDSKVKLGTNPRLRFLVIAFLGVLSMGVVLFWREKTLTAEEYIDGLPVHHHNLAALEKGALHSNNYQIDVQDTSPSVR